MLVLPCFSFLRLFYKSPCAPYAPLRWVFFARLSNMNLFGSRNSLVSCVYLGVLRREFAASPTTSCFLFTLLSAKHVGSPSLIECQLLLLGPYGLGHDAVPGEQCYSQAWLGDLREGDCLFQSILVGVLILGIPLLGVRCTAFFGV